MAARIFFSHIPKNGGMAIRYFLRNQYLTRDIFPHSGWDEFLADDKRNLEQYRLFQGHFHYDFSDLAGDVEIISFFRDPIQRTASLILHLQRDPKFNPLHGLASQMSFSDVLRHPHFTEMLSNHQTTYLGARLDFDRMLTGTLSDEYPDAVQLSAPADIRLALHRLRDLSAIGLTDRMGQSLNRICNNFRFHPSKIYSPRNAAPLQDREKVATITSDDRKIIASLNQQDIELYSAATAIFARNPKVYSFAHLVCKSVQRMGEAIGELQLAEPIRGSNWYEAENSGASHYRWAGPEDRSTLEFPASACDRIVRIVVFPFPGDNLSETLKVITDKSGQTLPESCGNGLIFTCYLRKTKFCIKNGFHQITFEHDDRYLSAPTNGDLRRLRFGISSITIDELPTV